MTIPVEQVPNATRLVPARGVAERYGIALRSVDRWLAKKILPTPDRIVNGRRYWLVASLERADRAHTADAAAE
jgi:hypothetical protein